MPRCEARGARVGKYRLPIFATVRLGKPRPWQWVRGAAKVEGRPPSTGSGQASTSSGQANVGARPLANAT